ncbi:prepilin peptidase, partial [Micromonospora purpureochromogenes]
MSVGLLTVAALCGGLVGAAAPTFANRFTTARSATGRWTLGWAVVGAVVFAGLAAALGPDPALPAYLMVAAVGVVLAVVDLACLRLPDPLVGA